MYEDFYPYIPGSLDARQRMRKRWLKRLSYGFGAFIVFSSGFLLGLAWYEPVSAPPQTALQYHRQLEAANPWPVKTLTPSAELAAQSLEPQPIAPSKLASNVALALNAETDTSTDTTLTETDASPLSSVMFASDTTAPPQRQHARAPAERHAEAVSRPTSPKPEQPQPSPQPSPRPYLVQVGAFRNEANAHGIVAKLRDKGYQPFIRTVQDRQHRVLHRVFLDRLEDKAQAQATAKIFEETEKMDALVILAKHLSLPDHRQPESR